MNGGWLHEHAALVTFGSIGAVSVGIVALAIGLNRREKRREAEARAADLIDIPAFGRIDARIRFAALGAAAGAVLALAMILSHHQLARPKAWLGFALFTALGGSMGSLVGNLRRQVGRLALDKRARSLTLTLAADTWIIELGRPVELEVAAVAPSRLYPNGRTQAVITQGEARIGFWVLNHLREPATGPLVSAPEIDLMTDRRGRVIYEFLVAQVASASA